MTSDKNQKRPYHIEPYDPEWVVRFRHIREFAQKAFGPKALAVEHIGSTSVPGMKAKPLIDALVVVEKMEPFEHEKQAFAAAGYECAENYIAPDSILFFKTELVGGEEEQAAQKTENIHVCEKGSYKEGQFLVTRDFLRTHPDWVKRYGEIKEKLNAQFPDDYVAYREGKKEFLVELERAARSWKESVGAEARQVGPENLKV